MSSAKDISIAEWDAEVAASPVPVVVDFWAPWCGPCRMVAPELEKLAGRVGDGAKFVKVNIDENQELAVRFGVMSIPTIAKFVEGKMAAQVVGAKGADALGKELGVI
jgi:thioredoxin 1